jgi:hypothetical protein
VLADQRDCLALARHNGRQGTAPNLAGDNHDLALARLFLSEPPVFAIGLSVLRFDVPAEIGTVDLDLAAQFGLVLIVNLRAHRFAELVQQHESTLRIDVEITADL